MFCFFKQKTAYEVRISDGSSDVCSSDLQCLFGIERPKLLRQEFEFASGHEAAGGYRAPIGVHIGKRVASRIEAVETSADCEVDDPCARRDDEIGRASCRERVCQYV